MLSDLVPFLTATWTAIEPILGWLLSIGLLSGLFELVKWLRSLSKEQESQRLSRAGDSYRLLEDRYFDMLKQILIHPHLGVGLHDLDPDELSELDIARRRVLYAMLFSLFERAYLEKDLTPTTSKDQWPGWEGFIARI